MQMKNDVLTAEKIITDNPPKPYAQNKPRIYFLSSNTLKIIAAISMVIDHVGFLFFPDVEILRILGRLAFPIFAFMIAEGCRYTKNKARYFSTIFVMAVVCQIVYYIFDKSLFMCVLVTFSLAIIVIYALQNFKKAIFSQECPLVKKCLSALILGSAVGAVYIFNNHFEVDYGFWGCMTPVFASLFDFKNVNASKSFKKLDKNPVHVLVATLPLVLTALQLGGVQMWGLLSIPFLMLYSGKRGKLSMKYFFYIFYPAHLALLQGIYMISG